MYSELTLKRVSIPVVQIREPFLIFYGRLVQKLAYVVFTHEKRGQYPHRLPIYNMGLSSMWLGQVILNNQNSDRARITPPIYTRVVSK